MYELLLYRIAQSKSTLFSNMYYELVSSDLVIVDYHMHCSARYNAVLGTHSALRGITFLSIFVYKYIADTSFTLISCSSYDDYGFVSIICNPLRQNLVHNIDTMYNQD